MEYGVNTPSCVVVTKRIVGVQIRLVDISMRIIRDTFVRIFLIFACTACSHVQGVGEATSFLPNEPKEPKAPKAPNGCVLQERDKLHLMHQVVDEAVDVLNFYTHPDATNCI